MATAPASVITMDPSHTGPIAAHWARRPTVAAQSETVVVRSCSVLPSRSPAPRRSVVWELESNVATRLRQRKSRPS